MDLLLLDDFAYFTVGEACEAHTLGLLQLAGLAVEGEVLKHHGFLLGSGNVSGIRVGEDNLDSDGSGTYFGRDGGFHLTILEILVI